MIPLVHAITQGALGKKKNNALLKFLFTFFLKYIIIFIFIKIIYKYIQTRR